MYKYGIEDARHINLSGYQPGVLPDGVTVKTWEDAEKIVSKHPIEQLSKNIKQSSIHDQNMTKSCSLSPYKPNFCPAGVGAILLQFLSQFPIKNGIRTIDIFMYPGLLYSNFWWRHRFSLLHHNSYIHIFSFTESRIHIFSLK